jgi:hypothetical protein
MVEPPMSSWSDFLTEVRTKPKRSDLLSIFAVAVVLSLVYLLPKPIQRSLMLDFADPTVLNLWTSAYVHRGFDHFSGNLVAYIVLISLNYLLLVLADERDYFRTVFFAFLLLLPPVVGVLNIVLIGRGTGAGFSGVDSAFVGLLVVSITIFTHKRISAKIGPNHGVVLLLVVFAVITETYAGILGAVAILLVSAALAVYDASKIGYVELKNTATELTAMPGHFELTLLAGLVFLVSPWALFPQAIAEEGAIVNILSHYLGFVFGFFGPAIFWRFNWNS